MAADTAMTAVARMVSMAKRGAIPVISRFPLDQTMTMQASIHHRTPENEHNQPQPIPELQFGELFVRQGWQGPQIGNHGSQVFRRGLGQE